MKEGWSNRFLGQMSTGVLMRCRSFKFTSLFTYSVVRYGFKIEYEVVNEVLGGMCLNLVLLQINPAILVSRKSVDIW